VPALRQRVPVGQLLQLWPGVFCCIGSFFSTCQLPAAALRRPFIFFLPCGPGRALYRDMLDYFRYVHVIGRLAGPLS